MLTCNICTLRITYILLSCMKSQFTFVPWLRVMQKRIINWNLVEVKTNKNANSIRMKVWTDDAYRAFIALAKDVLSMKPICYFDILVNVCHLDCFSCAFSGIYILFVLDTCPTCKALIMNMKNTSSTFLMKLLLNE